MKTKLKKLLSIALPVFRIVTAAAIATPLVVSCSLSLSEQKPSTPDNDDNGSGDSNNGGGSTTQTVKLSPKNKYTTWEAARAGVTISRSDKLYNGWISDEILNRALPEYNLISQYITIESVEAKIVDPLNRVATSTPTTITNVQKLKRIF